MNAYTTPKLTLREDCYFDRRGEEVICTIGLTESNIVGRYESAYFCFSDYPRPRSTAVTFLKVVSHWGDDVRLKYKAPRVWGWSNQPTWARLANALLKTFADEFKDAEKEVILHVTIHRKKPKL